MGDTKREIPPDIFSGIYPETPPTREHLTSVAPPSVFSNPKSALRFLAALNFPTLDVNGQTPSELSSEEGEKGSVSRLAFVLAIVAGVKGFGFTTFSSGATVFLPNPNGITD